MPFASQSIERPPEPVNPLATTLLGTTPAVPAPNLPQLVDSEEISEVGSVPLVNDPKLGWETAVKLSAPSDGSHTRLESDPVDYRIRSNATWIVLAIMLMVAIVAVLLTIIET